MGNKKQQAIDLIEEAHADDLDEIIEVLNEIAKFRKDRDEFTKNKKKAIEPPVATIKIVANTFRTNHVDYFRP
jgi:hypothetical protein